MKMFLNYKSFLLLLCMGLCTMSCNDQKDEISEIVPIQEPNTPANQQLDQNTLETVFTYLSAQENIKELSINEQFTLLQDFVETENLNLNLNLAIISYENNLDKFDNITKQEELLISEYRHINQLILQHGYNADLSQALEEYKQSFIQLTNKLDIDPATINIVLSIVEQTNAIVNNAGIQRYLHKVDSDLVSPNLNARGFLACLAAQIALAVALASCASNPFACAGVPLAIWNVQQQCGGDGDPPVDPCLNSPNPCCGVVCIQGYTCNSNGDCVVDIYYDCTVTGCPPGEQCLNNLCVPL